jgi:hypothetical protein
VARATRAIKTNNSRNDGNLRNGIVRGTTRAPCHVSAPDDDEFTGEGAIAQPCLEQSVLQTVYMFL